MPEYCKRKVRSAACFYWLVVASLPFILSCTTVDGAAMVSACNDQKADCVADCVAAGGEGQSQCVSRCQVTQRTCVRRAHEAEAADDTAEGLSAVATGLGVVLGLILLLSWASSDFQV